jgi:hypothetical protein
MQRLALGMKYFDTGAEPIAGSTRLSRLADACEPRLISPAFKKIPRPNERHGRKQGREASYRRLFDVGVVPCRGQLISFGVILSVATACAIDAPSPAPPGVPQKLRAYKNRAYARFGCPVERPTPTRRHAFDTAFYHAPLEICTDCPSASWPRNVGCRASGRYCADGSTSSSLPTPPSPRTLRFTSDLHRSLPRVRTCRCQAPIQPRIKRGPSDISDHRRAAIAD